MNDVNERKMEQRIHNELRDLPDLKAPKSLGPRVLAAIAARQQAPWWQKSWSDWPFSMKAVFLIMGISILGGLVMASTAIPQTSTFTTGISEWLATQLSSLKPYYDVAARLAESLGGTLEYAGPNFLWYILALIGVAYGTCIALGTLGYRLVLNKI